MWFGSWLLFVWFVWWYRRGLLWFCIQFAYGVSFRFGSSPGPAGHLLRWMVSPVFYNLYCACIYIYINTHVHMDLKTPKVNSIRFFVMSGARTACKYGSKCYQRLTGAIPRWTAWEVNIMWAPLVISWIVHPFHYTYRMLQVSKTIVIGLWNQLGYL